MTATKVEYKANIVVTRTIEHMPINSRLVAVRLAQRGEMTSPNTSIAQKRFSASLMENQSEMVLNQDNLEKLLAGKPYTTEKVVAVSEAFLSDAQKLGFPTAGSLHAAEFEADQTNYLTRLENGEVLRMVRIDYASHMMFDDEGNILPTGLVYDYMHGNMRNGAYDLEKVLALLQGKSHVSSYNKKPLAVEPVPYYNVSSGCSRSLACVLAPTQEQMTAIWERAKLLNPRAPSVALHEAAFDLDIWGFRAAGAALFSEYYATGSSDGEEDND